MRSIFTLLLFLLSSLALSPDAEARSRRLGLGVVVAGPTGITANYFYGKGKDVAASLGWSKDSFHLNLDHHWNNRKWIKADGIAINVYYGLGVRWLSYESREDRANEIGIRAPLGVQHIFKPVGIQIFFELAPVLNLIPSTAFGIDLALGARYFF